MIGLTGHHRSPATVAVNPWPRSVDSALTCGFI